MSMSIYSSLFWVVNLALFSSVLISGFWVYCRMLSEQARTALVYALPGARFFLGARSDVRAHKPLSIDNVTLSDEMPDEDIGQLDLSRVDVEALRGQPLVRGARVTLFAKSFIDITTSLSLILFMLPLMLITAIVIKLDSKGPVFYRQTRIGKNGQQFNILKFRSMRVDAEKDGVRWASENDSRVTRIGAFLRRSRIDEIPQAFNVLAGQMSFVGPRPERPEFISQLQAKVPHFNQRHSIKPGITGWAQVNYPYGASVDDAVQKLRYDLYYIQNYCILLDILIIIKTVRVAITGAGSR